MPEPSKEQRKPLPFKSASWGKENTYQIRTGGEVRNPQD